MIIGPKAKPMTLLSKSDLLPIQHHNSSLSPCNTTRNARKEKLYHPYLQMTQMSVQQGGRIQDQNTTINYISIH